MRLSRYFLPILRETPKEAEIVSHRLMLRAGMIRQEAAGIYAFLPLGYRVLRKVCRIVREEQDRAGAIEMLMPTLQPAELWRESGRYEDYGKEMLRIKDRHGRDLLYGPTNEEMIAEIFRAYVRSYKDLRLKAIPMVAETGPIGGNLSHEFTILAATGESEVYCHREYLDFEVPGESVDFEDRERLQAIVDRWTSLYAATSDKHDPAAFDAIPPSDRVQARGIEVGHIFYFGTKYSEPMKALVTGPDGVERAVHMGSYGIGPSRLVAAIIEACHDDAGIQWPEPVAPFRAIVLNLKQGDVATDAASEYLYRSLNARGLDVLYHDLDERPGSKFATADLIGVPWQILVGPKGLAAGKIELKRRADGAREQLAPDAAIDRLAA